jgi:hypothetical protein
LQQRFDTPFISSFPVGLAGTINFLEAVAVSFGVNCERAVREEKVLQEEIFCEFKDISGTSITFDHQGIDPDALHFACEVAGRIAITVDADGIEVPFPLSPPVGTTGIRRMLHRWRRAIHA